MSSDPRPRRTVVDLHTGEPCDDLLVIVTPTEAAKVALVGDESLPFLRIDHVRSTEAVLVQLSLLASDSRDELAEVIADAWANRAPKRLLGDHLGHG